MKEKYKKIHEYLFECKYMDIKAQICEKEANGDIHYIGKFRIGKTDNDILLSTTSLENAEKNLEAIVNLQVYDYIKKIRNPNERRK